MGASARRHRPFSEVNSFHVRFQLPLMNSSNLNIISIHSPHHFILHLPSHSNSQPQHHRQQSHNNTCSNPPPLPHHLPHLRSFPLDRLPSNPLVFLPNTPPNPKNQTPSSPFRLTFSMPPPPLHQQPDTPSTKLPITAQQTFPIVLLIGTLEMQQTPLNQPVDLDRHTGRHRVVEIPAGVLQ